jgi:hypothetical protein
MGRAEVMLPFERARAKPSVAAGEEHHQAGDNSDGRASSLDEPVAAAEPAGDARSVSLAMTGA